MSNLGCVLLAREVGHLAAFVRVLQLPSDKHRRTLPKQVGINLAAAMSTVQLLATPAAPSSGGQVTSRSLAVSVGACFWIVMPVAALSRSVSQQAHVLGYLQVQEKQHQECALANKAALVKLGVLESLLALAVGGGGIPSCPVRTQVFITLVFAFVTCRILYRCLGYVWCLKLRCVSCPVPWAAASQDSCAAGPL